MSTFRRLQLQELHKKSRVISTSISYLLLERNKTNNFFSTHTNLLTMPNHCLPMLFFVSAPASCTKIPCQLLVQELLSTKFLKQFYPFFLLPWCKHYIWRLHRKQKKNLDKTFFCVYMQQWGCFIFGKPMSKANRHQ